MKQFALCAALLALLITPAGAGSGAPAQGSSAAGASSTPMTSAPMFVQMAAMSDMFEIQSSQAALKNSKDADVQKFAQMMINDQTKMSTELKSLLQSANVSVQLPTSLSGEKAPILQQLSGLSGEKFDAMYWKAQVQAHQEALQLMQTYATGRDNPTLRQFAQKGIPAIQQHLQMAQKMMGGGKS
jgi:putative membrane protein